MQDARYITLGYMGQSKRTRRLSLPFIARWVVTITVISLLLYIVDLGDLGRSFLAVDWIPCFLAFCANGLSILCVTQRWRVLNLAVGVDCRFGWLFRIYLSGQFFAVFLPGSSGLDVYASYRLWRGFPGQRASLLTALLIDRLFGYGTLFLFAAAGFALVGGVGMGQLDMVWVLVGGSAVLLALLIITVLWRSQWRAVLANRFREQIVAVVSAFRGTTRLRVVSRAVVWSVAGHLFVFVRAWLVVLAMGLPFSFLEAAAITAVVTALASLPVSVGGHGVREGLYFVAFSVLMEGPANELLALAVVFSVVNYGLNLAWAAIGGVLLLQRTSTPDGSATPCQK